MIIMPATGGGGVLGLTSLYMTKMISDKEAEWQRGTHIYRSVGRQGVMKERPTPCVAITGSFRPKLSAPAVARVFTRSFTIANSYHVHSTFTTIAMCAF